VAGRSSLLRRAMRSEHAAGWSFAFPAVFLIGIVGIIPIVWSLLLSFQRNNLLAPGEWIGLANYEALSRDPIFKRSVVNSLIYTAAFVPLSVIGALAIAVALNRKIRFLRLYRTSVFITLATSTIATTIMFLWLLDPDYGIVNWGLQRVGVGRQGFFSDPSQAMVGIVAMTVWGWLGFGVIIYLAALQGVPAELVEAAEIDGAGRWAIFRRITLPLVGPATLFLVVWYTIHALQLFDEVFLATHGGPLYATTVVVFYVWQQAFEFFQAGYGAAIAYVLFVAILVLTVIQLWVGAKVTHYSS
jgi:multiple sugar transport system permease protein